MLCAAGFHDSKRQQARADDQARRSFPEGQLAQDLHYAAFHHQRPVLEPRSHRLTRHALSSYPYIIANSHGVTLDDFGRARKRLEAGYRRATRIELPGDMRYGVVCIDTEHAEKSKDPNSPLHEVELRTCKTCKAMLIDVGGG